MNVYEDWQSEIKLWPHIPDFTQRLAAFLLARGEYAWFGCEDCTPFARAVAVSLTLVYATKRFVDGFAGCDFPIAPQFLQAAEGKGPLAVQLGEPLEDCREVNGSSGVFARRWSAGKTTTLDCNAWVATIE